MIIKNVLPYFRTSVLPYFRTLSHPSRVVKNNLGFSLVAVLSATAISGILFSAILSMITLQQKEGKAIQQQLASASLKYNILQTLRNPENCMCQFPSGQQIKEEVDLNLPRFKSDCSSTAEVIAQPGQDIGVGVDVLSIKVADIRKGTTIPGRDPNTGDLDSDRDRTEFAGSLTVGLGSNGPHSLVRALRNIEVPLRFTADATGVIDECGSNTDHTAQLNQMRQWLQSEIARQQGEINANRVDINAKGIEINTNRVDINTNRVDITGKADSHGHPYSDSGHDHGTSILTAGTPGLRGPAGPRGPRGRRGPRGPAGTGGTTKPPGNTGGVPPKVVKCTPTFAQALANLRASGRTKSSYECSKDRSDICRRGVFPRGGLTIAWFSNGAKGGPCIQHSVTRYQRCEYDVTRCNK